METRLRLSHSSLELLNSCERKFQLHKLLAEPKKEDSAHLWFGRAFGAGVAEYLLTQSMDRAIFRCWLEYDSKLEEKRKTEASCTGYLIQSLPYLNTLLQDYEVAHFNGKPAIELSFKLNINDWSYYVGHIDVVLKNRTTGKYYILEVKTTTSILLDLAPQYRHSGQAVGYSIALDRIVGEELSEYGVLYFVAQIPSERAVENIARFHPIPFDKTLTDRLQWFVSVGMDVQRIHEMMQLNIFPRRSKSCVAFNRVCPQYGTCHLHQFDQPAPVEPDEIEYDFEYDLEDLIVQHMERISAAPQMIEERMVELD